MQANPASTAPILAGKPSAYSFLFGSSDLPTFGNRLTTGKSHPAQLKPPRDPQLLLEVEKPPPPNEVLKDATAEIFFFVSWLLHVGQVGLRSASEKRTIFSKSSPQSLQ
jgi:hypothetical protein